MAADTFGRPIRFILTAGQSGDALADPALLEGFRPQAALADIAYDSNLLRQLITDTMLRYAIGTVMLLFWLAYYYIPRREDVA